MPLFDIPDWIKPHLYTGRKFNDLTKEEILSLKTRLSHFCDDNPDVSVVIPAWNEENNIYRTLSSLSANQTRLKVEIVVVNNNSTDKTQQVLDELGVRSFFQPVQGTSFARQMGLFNAKGTIHLCADSDTYYPPAWIDLMVKPLLSQSEYVGVYGRYSFIPADREARILYFFYEKITGFLIRLRKQKREHINVLGFNMGFITRIGRENGGFEVSQARKFDNAIGSDYFVDEAEDGRMALNLKKVGKLKLVTHPKARVFTSSRRLTAEGGLAQSFSNRVKLHSKRIREYLFGSKV